MIEVIRLKKYMTVEKYIQLRSMDKEKDNSRKKVKKIVIFLFMSIILFSLYTIFNWLSDNSKIQQIKREIDKNIEVERNYHYGELVNPPKDKNSNYYYYVSFPFYKVSFSILTSKNKDTVGFVRVRNTNIHYPVVQTIDNQYYLNHDFNRKENKAGWIFFDYRSNLKKLGDNTVIYGHARLDGSLFGSLKNVLTSSWQKNRDNYVIFLSTSKENMVFQIFSIYTIESEGYYITPNFDNPVKKQLWLDTMKKRNIAPIDTEVHTSDKILTLSTCKDNQGGRVVVHAKLIKRQKAV